MQPIPTNAREALAIYTDPNSEDWERDYAAKLIGELEEGRDALLATARDDNADGMLQQRAAECLSYAWRELGVLMSADVSGFTTTALQEILFQRGEVADIRIYGSDTWISGRCDLQPMLEPVAKAASAWWAKMRDKFLGLDVRFFVLRSPAYDRADAIGVHRPDFRSLAAPMREFLECRLPAPLGLEAWDHSLELVRERGRDQLFHRIGKSGRTGSTAALINRRHEPLIWRQINSLLEPQADLPRALGDFVLGVEARHIDGVVDAVRSSRTFDEDAVVDRTG